MIKRILVLSIVMLVCVEISQALDTRYYKLTRMIVDGTTSTNVSGGQFISFIGNKCYESNINGVSVDNGVLTKNTNYSTSQYIVYQGPCYYGNNVDFKFNSDKSVLNIITAKGDIYVYKCATPPQGVETCSLIKSNQQTPYYPSKNSNQPDYSAPIYYDPLPISPSSNTSQPSTPQKKWRTVTRQVDCPSCHGTGQCPSCNGSGHLHNIGTSGTRDCPNCHNGRCSTCGGSGKITKTEQVYE